MLLKLTAATPIGRLAVSEHAMSAVGELLALNHAFEKIKQKAGTSTLNWDGLEIAGF